MDEILASIRRIIESSDEKTGTGPAATAARIAAADRAALARDAASDRPTSFTLPVPASRVVAFSDRTASASAPKPVATDDADERWMPLTEPANAAGEPPVAEHEEPSTSTETVAAETVEPVVAADRWARELDDVETWSVLDTPAASAATETPAEMQASASASEPVSAEPASAEPVFAEPILAEIVSPEAAAPDLPAVVPAVEPEIATAEPAAADDDFMVDFNEADFVEAIDRNAALVSVRGEVVDEVSASSAFAETAVPASLPSIEAIERSVLPAFFASQAPLPAMGAAEAAVARPSVLQQTSALMSEEAGTQVAAAFDDLARVIRDGQMKSMEDIARGMLRPMLQEWLDDNLPRLVERLVREEIERVSRGPSR